MVRNFLFKHSATVIIKTKCTATLKKKKMSGLKFDGREGELPIERARKFTDSAREPPRAHKGYQEHTRVAESAGQTIKS